MKRPFRTTGRTVDTQLLSLPSLVSGGRYRTTPRGSGRTLDRDLHLWRLSDLPEEITITQYGPTARQMLQSVLVPIAGGPHSQAAVRVAAELAREWDASIRILTVVPTEGSERSKAETYLENQARRVNDVPTSTELLQNDDVVGAIGERSGDYELVVVGDSERSLFERLFDGSVPERLKNRMDVPLFVVKRTE